MTFIYNNLCAFAIPILILISFILFSMSLSKMGVTAIKYKPPLKPEDMNNDDMEEVDPDLIQYWPNLFTDNDF